MVSQVEGFEDDRTVSIVVTQGRPQSHAAYPLRQAVGVP
jgi:hypothetical protein